MRRSSFPPELQQFVDTVEENAQAAGHSSALARIFGAWSACYVRFCTVNDRTWRDAEHVPAFLDYLDRREDVGDSSREHAAKSMVFLFEELLKMDLSDAVWHPERQSENESETSTTEKPTGDRANAAEGQAKEQEDEEGEQSTLLTRLLFHTSLPINEALELCAGDVDLDAGLIYVSDSMGTPKRIIELPDTLNEPLRDHLNHLREKHGRRFFDAPLFQARALKGRVDEDEGADAEAEEKQSEPVAAEGAPEDSSDKPASLWGYTNDE